MPTIYTPRITDAGKAAAVSQHGLGLSLDITHVQVGSASYTPNASQTALTAPLHKGLVSGYASNGNRVSGAARVMSAGYTGSVANIGEIGFFAGDPTAGGTLVMILSEPGVTYGQIGGSVASDLLLSVTLQIDDVPPGSITLAVDPGAGDAAAIIRQHISDPLAHPNIDGIPIGMMLPFYGANVPAGFVPPIGVLLERSTFAQLWAHAQAEGLVVSEAEWIAGKTTYFSSGDGSTTFRLPDLRGEALRVWDQGRGVDVGRTLASWQSYATARPQSTTSQAIIDNGTKQTPRGPGQSPLPLAQQSPSLLGFVRVSKAGSSTTGSRYDTGDSGKEADSLNVMDGDIETRPRNVAVSMAIKAGPSTLPRVAVTSISTGAPTTPPAPAPAPPPGSAPVVDFTGSPRATYATDYEAMPPVFFQDLSVGTALTSWLWDFGDGTISTDRNPVHQFPDYYAGAPIRYDDNGLKYSEYNVTLTVTDASGASTTVTKIQYIRAERNSSNGSLGGA